MKQYILITKMLLKNWLRGGSFSKHKVLTCIVGVGVLLFMFMLGLIANYLAPVFAVAEMTHNLTADIMFVAFVVVLVFGTMGIFTYVYFSKDNEFLLSLPVKPSAVYFSKLTIVYLQEFILGFIIMFPTLLMTGISTLQSPVFYIIMLLAIIVVPVAPLVLCSVIAIPVMRLAVFFKHKNMAGAIVLIVLFALGMAIYMFVVFGTNNVSYQPSGGEITIDDIRKMLAPYELLSYIVYPLLSFARVATLTVFWTDIAFLSILIDFVIAIGSIAVCGVLTVIISSAVYAKTALSQGEQIKNVGRSSAKHEKNSVFRALLKKEWIELSRNTSFAFQCLSGVVIGPIVSIFYIMLYSGLLQEMSEFKYIVWLIGFAFMHFMSFNVSAMTGITREGKTFSYSKTIPVGYATQLKAKFLLSFIINAVTVVLMVVANYITILVVTGHFSPEILIMSLINLVELLLLGCVTIVLSLWHDLKKPNLGWVTPREAIRKNMALVLPLWLDIIVNLLISAGVILGVVFLSDKFLGSFGFVCFALSLLIVVEVVLFIPLYKALMRKADTLYDSLTV